ncbi:hypothetical protein RUM44_001493 [Polyplax serrata]|uniref:Uncharacterized protein n=1 Tax=Polyplax serrata TaxID=468196 RepID=A0ABR1AK61_POLSC
MKNTLVVCLVFLVAVNCVTSRWLPTRSQEDRLDKLREMLKELLESEIEKSNYENKYMYKRDVGPQIEKIETAEESEDRPMLQEKAIQKQ